jgi:sec-independent protein translocase protein TatC
MLIGFGLAFQLPLLMMILGWLGFISSKALRDKRRHAIVIIFILAMVLTPPDPFSQIIMAVPMCLLYEVCIGAIWLREKARLKTQE